MLKEIIKRILQKSHIDIRKEQEKIARWSISGGLHEKGFGEMVDKLRRLEPDISKQYSRGEEKFNSFWELKVRGLHAFQCTLMLKALENQSKKDRITVVDIGDSAGTHMSYLKELAKEYCEIDSLSVNLDERAVEKIRSKGMNAMLCRAEELDLGDKKIDMFVSFEMVEHLHNPAKFFHRLAEQSKCNRILITVPYVRQSRVGLHSLRGENKEVMFAEDEHIFELSPDDWSLLIQHAGWKVVYQDVYYQYPRRMPIANILLSKYWRKVDFEGFWGALLEKDDTYSKLYADWEN